MIHVAAIDGIVGVRATLLPSLRNLLSTIPGQSLSKPPTFTQTSHLSSLGSVYVITDNLSKGWVTCHMQSCTEAKY